MTRRSEELRGLAERCEKLAGPDWIMDANIGMAVASETANEEAEPYTADLNAAMSLVPEGWTLDLQVRSHFSHAFLECQDSGREVSAQNAATPALALCAAALRALAGDA
jgi:hypothetical protein